MTEKTKKTDTLDLPECAREFIKLVIKRMGYRKKVRRDVLAELAMHFEDELKGCDGAEERTQKARQLIADFGDAKLLGILLRRAKKRCRPLWRTIIVRTLQTAGVILVLFCIYTAWFVGGRPNISIDYLAMLNRMSRPELLDEQNAWPHYEKAVRFYVEPSERIRGLVGSGWEELGKRLLCFDDLDEDRQSEVRKWIEKNEASWDKLSAEQQQVIGECIHSGLVPYRSMGSTEPFGGRKAQHFYERLDTAIDFILRQIPEELAGESQSGPEDAGMQMLMMRQGYPEFFMFDPNEPMDAQLAGWADEDALPEDFDKAIKVAVAGHWMGMVKPSSDRLSDRLLPFESEALEKWIADNEAAWNEFAAGAARPFCYRQHRYGSNDDQRLLIEIILPHLRDLKTLARLAIWRARLEVEQDRLRQGLENCLSVARAGAHWQRSKVLVEQLVGLSMKRLADEEILQIVERRKLLLSDLQWLKSRFSQIYPQGFPLVDVSTERLCFLDLVQNLFTGDGPGGGHLIPKRLAHFGQITDFRWEGTPSFILSTAAGMVHARRNQTLEKGKEVYDLMERVSQMTPYQRHVDDVSGDEVLMGLNQYRFFLLHIVAPALGRATELGYHARAEHKAVEVILLLEQQWLEKGEYPSSLNELVDAGHIETLPMDPYSDKPLVYKRQDGDFVLYSVGSNFTDNGGKPGVDDRGRVSRWGGRDGDIIFWPLPKSKPAN